MKKLILFISLWILSVNQSNAFWGNSHERITRETLLVRKYLLDEKINELGFNLGIFEIFGHRNVILTVQDAGKTEDNGIRFRNHFYNPLDGSGLNDVFSGDSSYEWANETTNHWSWRNARKNFYLGLTAPSDAERRSALADSFRALGQVMHLVQDKAVPAHVRNDGHMRPDGFEKYASENENAGLLNYAPVFFAGPKYSLSSYAPRQLWDAELYDGTNPSTSTAIGLAEYTNANFASEDTIFTEDNLADWNPLNNKHYFPYPRREDTVVFAESQDKMWNGFEVYRKYFEKVRGGQPIKHFATASRLYAYLLDDPEPSIQGFDDRCYKDYADLLIPRAVGYSAALLDYFFRGKIDLVADPGNPGQYVIKNESDEDMTGTFTLYYDDSNGIRKPVTDGKWENLGIAAKATSSPLIFTAPSDAKEAGKYALVFNGAHGAESEAVVGKEVALVLDNKIRIRLYDPDGTQIRRDVLFNVWAYRADTGDIGKVVAATWQYNDSAQHWEISVPSQSATMVYDPKTNYWSSSTPSGGFDLNKGVYLDYLWKAGAVGVAKMTYYGPYQWGSNLWAEEENRNFATQLQSLWFKAGYKPKVQPIPGIEVLRVYPVGEYQIKLVYDPETKEISLGGASKTVIKNNSDAGLYGLSIPGYSAMVVKVSPSALPSAKYSVDFGLNSGRLDKDLLIRAGSPWTQYPGHIKTSERFIPASRIHVNFSGILEDEIPYIHAEQAWSSSYYNENPITVSSTIDYLISVGITESPYAYYSNSTDPHNRVVLTTEFSNNLEIYHYRMDDMIDGPLGNSGDNHIITQTWNGITAEYIDGPTVWASWVPEYSISSEDTKIYDDFSVTLNDYTNPGTNSFSRTFPPGKNAVHQAIANFGAPLSLTLFYQIWDYIYDRGYWKLLFIRETATSFTATNYVFRAVASGPVIPLK